MSDNLQTEDKNVKAGATGKTSTVALVILSIAISYLAFSIFRLSNAAFGAVDGVDKVNQNLPQVIEVAKAYQKIIPEVNAELKAIRSEIPQILDRVDRLQNQVDAIRKEAPELVNSNLPEILSRIDKTNKQVDELYAKLPQILETVNKINQTIDSTNQRVAAITPMIPEVIGEVKLIRESLPETLTRVEKIVEQSKEITKEAGENMFTGILRGIVRIPFDILRAPAKLFQDDFTLKSSFTNEDFDLSIEAVKYVLAQETLVSRTWRNPKTKNEGIVKAIEDYRFEGKMCRKFEMTMITAKGKSEKLIRDACINKEGKWESTE